MDSAQQSARTSHSANAEFYLPNYRLGKTLGIGSFGKVKVADHVLTGHKVAIKILNRRKIRSMDMEEKVRREIKILRLFMHPHIIRLYEVIETPHDIFVVMEYVKAGELFDYIVEKGRLLEDEARRFFQQIVAGVEYCHRNMVVHRDLKPENLLLDSNENVKIADFGLSNVMRDGHFLKTSCGSPNYAAPEVISGRLYAGPEVDVWSCGVILYALLCGSLPFDDENIPNLFKKIKGGIYTLPNHLSGGARDLIPKMLLVDPMKRVTIPEIRQHPWFQAKLPRYLAVPPPDTLQQAKRVDEDILQEVLRMGFDRNQVVESLRSRAHNKATVAYFLMLDNRRGISSGYLGAEFSEGRMMMQQQHQPSMLDAAVRGAPGATSASASNTTTAGLGGRGRSSGSRGLSPTSRGMHHRVVADKKWGLGLQLSRAHPVDIMRELLRSLRELNVTWKKLGAYSIRCRWVGLAPLVVPGGAGGGTRAAGVGVGGRTQAAAVSLSDGGASSSSLESRDHDSVMMMQMQHHHHHANHGHAAGIIGDGHGHRSTSGSVGQVGGGVSGMDETPHEGGTSSTPREGQTIKFEVQLYKVREERYVLDVQKVEGATFLFLDLCARVLGELKVV